jgi:HK97 family phage portal protein
MPDFYGQYQGTAREPRVALPASVSRKTSTAVIDQKSAGGLIDAVNSLAFPQPLLYAALGGYASNTGVPVTPLTSLQAAAVYGCTRCISEDIAGLDLLVRRRLPNGGWMIEYDHPLMALFGNPNRWQTPFEFLAYVLTCYCLRGNAFVVISRDLDGRPIELIPVSPDRVTIRISELGYIWYLVNSRHIGYGVLVPPDDMMHLKNISIDGYLGLSPIACAQDVIGLALATQQHGSVLFRQGGQINGVLQFPGKLGKEATDNVAQSWRDTHGGVQNAHKIVVLEEGGKFEKVGMTNEDAQFLATRQFQVVDICARIYRVPPHKLGELGRATFANLEQQQQQYIDDGLRPITTRWEQLARQQLLFDDERGQRQVIFDFSSLLRGDQKTRYEAYQIALLNGFMNRNEVRALESMNPVPGGDQYRVPLNTADPMHPENIPQQIPVDPGNDGGGDDAQDGDGDPV